jgi:hypothetical protein
MIAEVIDAMICVGWALIVWIMIGALLLTVVLSGLVLIALWIWGFIHRAP